MVFFLIKKDPSKKRKKFLDFRFANKRIKEYEEILERISIDLEGMGKQKEPIKNNTQIIKTCDRHGLIKYRRKALMVEHGIMGHQKNP